MRTPYSIACLIVFLGGCGLEPQPQANSFRLTIVPDRWNDAFVGQKVVLLVTVEDETTDTAAKGEDVSLTAEASNCDVSVVLPRIFPGQVGEVFVVPHSMPSGSTVTAKVRGTRGGVEQTAQVSFGIRNELDDLGPEAAEMRDRFVEWLAANRPELDITADTAWDGTSVQHLLVVSHYMFLSEDWEMGVQWHIMIPPYDWAQIYLRRRFVEEAPSWAFEISSRSDPGSEPHEIEPPEAVRR